MKAASMYSCSTSNSVANVSVYFIVHIIASILSGTTKARKLAIPLRMEGGLDPPLHSCRATYAVVLCR
jgi:hypothetical protein